MVLPALPHRNIRVITAYFYSIKISVFEEGITAEGDRGLFPLPFEDAKGIKDRGVDTTDCETAIDMGSKGFHIRTDTHREVI